MGTMNRLQFERLRELPDKAIRDDVVLEPHQHTYPVYRAEDVLIENSLDWDVRMTITYNPKTLGKSINVHVVGIGPICRLEIDNKPHDDVGRSHKHSLATESCPEEQLHRRVTDRTDLKGKTIKEGFEILCEMANISHNGEFIIRKES